MSMTWLQEPNIRSEVACSSVLDCALEHHQGGVVGSEAAAGALVGSDPGGPSGLL